MTERGQPPREPAPPAHDSGSRQDEVAVVGTRQDAASGAPSAGARQAAPLPVAQRSALSSVYLGLGSNLGDRAANLRAALALLEAAGVVVQRRAPLYESKPMGVIDQPDFLNTVAEVTTGLEPLALLAAVKGVEEAVGRTPGTRWGPRVVDVDILLYDEQQVRVAEPWLEIPHPELWRRQFVLVPLADLRHDLRAPDGTPIEALIARLRAAEGAVVWRYAERRPG